MVIESSYIVNFLFYDDHVLVFLLNLQEHVIILRAVLRCLENTDLVANVKKSVCSA